MNIPISLLHDLQHIQGFNEQAFIDVHHTKVPISVRRHPVKGEGLFAGNEKVNWCNGGVYLPERPIFTLDPAYHSGAYYVQEASSMFLAHMLKDIIAGRTGLRVLDLCAAPGGKSTLIASMLDKESLLISNEVIRTRASILEENMSRWGYMNTWVTSNDPKDLGKADGYFDIIVVDAPCSGSGLWRKDHAALNEWSEDNVALCSARQQRILEDVWPALKQDGVLVYATCSYSPQEDEAVLDALAKTHNVTGIHAIPDPEWGIEEVQSPVEKIPAYRFFPDKVRGEGFFIAAVRNNEEAGSVKPARFKTAHSQKINDQAKHLLQAEDVKAQLRLSACPCLLLDAGFAQSQRWDAVACPGVMDAGVRGGYFGGRSGVALVRRTLVFVWHLARSNRVGARVILGMNARSAERIAASRLADLEAVAELAPGWIVPRWERQPNVWRQLLRAGCRGQPLMLRQAQLRGLQLLARAAGARGASDG